MRVRGFTFVELLVVLTISAILVAAGIPSFVWLMSTTRVSSAANNLSAAFDRARSEAIRRGVVVSVCRTLNPNALEPALACTNAAGGGYAAGDWAAGWVLFEKRTLSAVGFFDWNGGVNPDVVLQREQAVSPGPSRLLIVSDAAGAAVAYNNFGSAAVGADTPAFSIDHRNIATVPLSGASRCLEVFAVTGRVLIRRPTAGEAAGGACL